MTTSSASPTNSAFAIEHHHQSRSIAPQQARRHNSQVCIDYVAYRFVQPAIVNAEATGLRFRTWPVGRTTPARCNRRRFRISTCGVRDQQD